MAKRLSSLFSLGSDHSDQSSESRQSSSLHPARPPKKQRSIQSLRDQSSTHLARKSLPDLRPSSNLYALDEQSSGFTPPFDPSILPQIVDDAMLLQPPTQLKPMPLRSQSPDGSVAGSRPISRGSRQESGASSYLTCRPESRSASRPASPTNFLALPPTSRSSSRSASRPASPIKFLAPPTTSHPLTPTTEPRLRRRKSWMPGKLRKESADEGTTANSPQAWIVPELWDEQGNTLIYLHAREGGRGPSFKLDSACFASSKKLTQAAYGGMQDHKHATPKLELIDLQQHSSNERVQHLTLNSPQSPPTSRPGLSTNGSSKGSRSASDYFEEMPVRQDIRLCLPLPLQADLANPTSEPSSKDIEALVTIRNVFAFLLGQPLVATPKQTSMFTIFLKIAEVMQRYEFTNLDGSTLGEEASVNLAKYIQDFGLADVRLSREKTIEAIVLGERLRSWELYNEGFVHAVGKYDEISGLKSQIFPLITDVTRKRMERAHLDLYTRLRTVQTRLDDFDFPSLFAGAANSSTSKESKLVNFKEWKAAYSSMRRHVMSLYKHTYGAWPPKARSKKNDFEESGLNRLLLLELYRDFSDLYDILVDRTALTNRSRGLSTQEALVDEEPARRALRKILDEYDRSTPPIQPPVPFDTPLLPSLSKTRRNFDTLAPKKQQKERTKRLRDDEINNALMQSYNRDSVKSTPFLEAFMSYERRSAHGKSIEEIAELRYGQWIFMYAVLQALPLVVVDAPGATWTKGVEYFLCEVPKGSPPWVQERHTLKQSWYGIAGGSSMVSLPADVVEHGVEGIYRRSHCWQVADKWAGPSDMVDNPVQEGLSMEELLSPVMPSAPDFRTSSQSPNRRRPLALGLEQMPLPPGVAPSGARPVSIHDPSINFAAILGDTNGVGKKKKN